VVAIPVIVVVVTVVIRQGLARIHGSWRRESGGFHALP
jgi:hypothetical protein